MTPWRLSALFTKPDALRSSINCEIADRTQPSKAVAHKSQQLNSLTTGCCHFMACDLRAADGRSAFRDEFSGGPGEKNSSKSIHASIREKCLAERLRVGVSRGTKRADVQIAPLCASWYATSLSGWNPRGCSRCELN